MTGSVRRRGTRSWELKFDLEPDPVTGKRRSRYHSFKGTKREAEAELVRLIAAAHRGDYVDPSKQRSQISLTVGRPGPRPRFRQKRWNGIASW
jgi:hypothetical protein